VEISALLSAVQEFPPLGTRIRTSLFPRLSPWSVDETVALSGVRRRSYRPTGRVSTRHTVSPGHSGCQPWNETHRPTLSEAGFPASSTALVESVSPPLPWEGELGRFASLPESPAGARSAVPNETTHLPWELLVWRRSLPTFCADGESVPR